MALDEEALETLVKAALAGNTDASVKLHELCEDLAQAKRVSTHLVALRTQSNRKEIEDWLASIRELHPGTVN